MTPHGWGRGYDPHARSPARAARRGQGLAPQAPSAFSSVSAAHLLRAPWKGPRDLSQHGDLADHVDDHVDVRRLTGAQAPGSLHSRRRLARHARVPAPSLASASLCVWSGSEVARQAPKLAHALLLPLSSPWSLGAPAPWWGQAQASGEEQAAPDLHAGREPQQYGVSSLSFPTHRVVAVCVCARARISVSCQCLGLVGGTSAADGREPGTGGAPPAPPALTLCAPSPRARECSCTSVSSSVSGAAASPRPRGSGGGPS